MELNFHVFWPDIPTIGVGHRLITQNGHGMLPMLAESKKGFVAVKVVNMIFAFIVGVIGLLFRF